MMARPGRTAALSLRSRIFRRLVYRPSIRRLQSHPVLAELRRLEEEQWRPAEEIDALHHSRLLQSVCHAAGRVPYYRDLFKEWGLDGAFLKFPEDLQRLPILRREDLAAGRDLLAAERPLPAGSCWNHTGGSTGQPVSFLQENDYRAANLAATARHDRWAGWDFGERTALLWGADRDLAAAHPRRERLELRWLRRQVELDAFGMGREEMERFARLLTRFRPRVIRGYASALVLFARHLQSHPLPFPAPKGIISCAETLTDPMRRDVEQVFGAPVFDRYGSREFGLIASQCERGAYHVNTRGVYVEILDGRQRAAPGSAGRVVITGLASRSMPLLRYDTGDVAEVPVEGRCECGRGLPVMGRVHGRASNFIAAPDGRLVHGEFFTHLFYGRDCVREFALHQDAEGTLVLSVAGEGEALQGQLEEIVEAIHQRLGGQARLSVHLVPRIEASASGKHCFVRSDAAAARWASGAVSSVAGDR